MKMKLTIKEKALIDLRLKPKAAEPCKTFVVLTSCEKQDILHPDVVGPFESIRAAYIWVAELPNAYICSADSPWAGEVGLEPADGGYAGFAIVNEVTASSPEEYKASRWDDEDDEE